MPQAIRPRLSLDQPMVAAAAPAQTRTITVHQQETPPSKAADAGPAPVAYTKQVFDAAVGNFVTANVIMRESAKPGSTFRGPALVMEDQTTTFVPSAFDGRVSPQGHLVLQRRSET